MSVLYISYNGLLEPLGQSQVFQYLRQLAANHKIFLVTYEKKKDRDNKSYFQDIAKLMRESDILWFPLSYHKQPAFFSTLYDLLVGSAFCFYICCRYRIRIVHARAYVPAVLGWVFQKVFGLKFIFDMRSFWPDDLLGAGIFKRSSIIYKTAKWLEHQFLISADVVIALTHKAVDVMKGYPFVQKKKVHFEVIPTCVNLDLFRSTLCKQNGNVNKQFFTLGYVGNAGPLYLFNEALQVFKILLRRRPEAMFLIINRDDHGYILECLQKQGINPKNFKVKSLEHRCVPLEIVKMDAGVFFYAQTNSHASRAPTKLGEFLACGIPCLANAGVGDVQEILESSRAGIVLGNFDMPSLENAVDQLLALVKDPEVKNRCVATAQRYFSLEMGVQAYDRIYRDLMRRGNE